MALAVALLCLLALWCALWTAIARGWVPSRWQSGRWVWLLRPFVLHVHTRALNATFAKVGTRRTLLPAVRACYGLGAVASTVLSVAVAVGLLWLLCARALWAAHPVEAARSVSMAVRPVIPGLTVPLSHIACLLLAVAIAVLVHEAGHGMAAAAHGLNVTSVGAFLVLIMPGAYVIVEPGLRSTSGWTRLKVCMAGVWHNLLLCGAVWLTTIACVHALRFVLFEPAAVGAVVETVPAHSPWAQLLRAGDVVTAVNGGAVASTAGWLTTLEMVQQDGAATGFCLSWPQLHPPDCCQPATVAALAGTAPAAAALRTQPRGEDRAFAGTRHTLGTATTDAHTVCMRMVAGSGSVDVGGDAAARQFCVSPDSLRQARASCDVGCAGEGEACVAYSAGGSAPPDALLLRLDVTPVASLTGRPTGAGAQLPGGAARHLFVGTAGELAASLLVSDWLPGPWLRWLAGRDAGEQSWLYTVGVSLPQAASLLGWYIFAASLSLAALNAAPCWQLDGQELVLLAAPVLVAALRRAGVGGGMAPAALAAWVLHAGSALVGACVVLAVAGVVLR